MMCCCPAESGAAGAAAPPSRARSAVPQPGRARALALARAQTWMDAHAHPGRCFLLDLPTDDPFVRLMGAPEVERSCAEISANGFRLATFATVADLRVLTVTAAGIRAGRAFAPGEAAADHRRQLETIGRSATTNGRSIVRRGADLWRSAADGLGVVVTCEGADFLEGRLDDLQDAHDRGVRSITLVHYRVNELGDVQTEAPVHGGLTAFGAEVVRAMNRLGMVIDLAHAPWNVTRDVLSLSTAPVMISHSHLARGASPHPRLLSAEHALAVARTGGVVAAWPAGVALATFDEYVDEILRMIDLLGVDHVAIGTDMDANFRPVLASYGQFGDLAAALLARGVTEEELGRVLGGNVARLFASVIG